MAEDVAVCWLVERGYRVLERNFRARVGEIDLIVQEQESRERTVCFVEVKSRAHRRYGGAFSNLSVRQKQRIRAAATLFLARYEEIPVCRFDVVTVEREGEDWRVRHLENAF